MSTSGLVVAGREHDQRQGNQLLREQQLVHQLPPLFGGAGGREAWEHHMAVARHCNASCDDGEGE